MEIFAIKHRNELTWDELPFVEAPVFAHTHIMNVLKDPNNQWLRIGNIDEFVRNEIGYYNSLRNHDYANNTVEYLIGSGQYFNVSRTGKPFCAAFTWQEDEAHPHKGFWVDSSNNYWRAAASVNTHLMNIANRWHRLQMLSSSKENSLEGWVSRTSAVVYSADLFTAQGMKSGYALSSPEQLKYISPVTEKSEIEPVDYLGIVDDTLKEFEADSTPTLSVIGSGSDNSGLQPLTLKLGDKGQFVKDAQMSMLSRGWEQPVLGSVGPTTQANMNSFNTSLASGTLPLVKYGVNPSKAEVQKYLAELAEQEGVPLTAAKALLEIESSGGIQFTSQGLPLVNPEFNSSAVGIMQIVDSGARQAVLDSRGEPLYTYREIAYDWKKNMQVGMKYYGQWYSKTNGTELERASNAYQAYHDGHFDSAAVKDKNLYEKKYENIK